VRPTLERFSQFAEGLFDTIQILKIDFETLTPFDGTKARAALIGTKSNRANTKRL